MSGTGLVSFDGNIELAPSTGGAFADSVGNVADGALLATGVTPETYTIDIVGHTVTIDATVEGRGCRDRDDRVRRGPGRARVG